MTRGGARRGAGRKPLPVDEKRHNTSFALTRPAIAKIKARAVKRGCSRNDVVERWAMRIRESAGIDGRDSGQGARR